MSQPEYEREVEVFGPSQRSRVPRVFRKVHRHVIDLALTFMGAEASRMGGDMDSYMDYISQAERIVQEMADEYGIEVEYTRFRADWPYGRLYLEARVVYTRFGACFADYCWFDACALDEEDTYGESRFAVSVVVDAGGRVHSLVLTKLPVRYS